MKIEGRNPVLEALRAHKKIKKLFIKQTIEPDQKVSEILELAQKQRISTKYTSKKHLDKLSMTGIHQGVIAFAERTEAKDLSGLLHKIDSKQQSPFLIYVREAQNEYNVGSIVRSAECAGIQGVILPPKTQVSPQMIRSAMGATAHVDLINESLFTAIKTAKANGIKVVGIEVSGSQYYHQTDLTGPIMLIIGGEDRSLSEEVTSKCDMVVKIPLLGKVNSLNMSIAASIVMFEKVRQEG